MNRNDGRNVNHVTSVAASARPRNGASAPNGAATVAALDPMNATTTTSGPSGRLAEREPVDHLRGREPSVVPDCALVTEREHGVCAAEREQRGFGEAPIHLGEAYAFEPNVAVKIRSATAESIAPTPMTRRSRLQRTRVRRRGRCIVYVAAP